MESAAVGDWGEETREWEEGELVEGGPCINFAEKRTERQDWYVRLNVRTVGGPVRGWNEPVMQWRKRRRLATTAGQKEGAGRHRQGRGGPVLLDT